MQKGHLEEVLPKGVPPHSHRGPTLWPPLTIERQVGEPLEGSDAESQLLTQVSSTVHLGREQPGAGMGWGPRFHTPNTPKPPPFLLPCLLLLHGEGAHSPHVAQGLIGHHGGLGHLQG